MKKSELIEQLQAIEGDPEVIVNDDGNLYILEGPLQVKEADYRIVGECYTRDAIKGDFLYPIELGQKVIVI